MKLKKQKTKKNKNKNKTNNKQTNKNPMCNDLLPRVLILSRLNPMDPHDFKLRITSFPSPRSHKVHASILSFFRYKVAQIFYYKNHKNTRSKEKKFKPAIWMFPD